MADQEKAKTGQGTDGTNKELPSKRPEAGKASTGGTEASHQRARQEVDESLEELRAELDALDTGDTLARLQSWVADNPTLAVFLAAGGGILTGRFLALLRRPFRPAPLPVRARRRTEELASETQRYARDASERTRQLILGASEEARRRSRELGTELEHRSKEVAETLSEQVQEARHRAQEAGETATKGAAALGALAAAQAKEWSEAASEKAKKLSETTSARARETQAALSEQTERLSKEAQKRTQEARKRAQATGAAVRERADRAGEVLGAAGLGTAVQQSAHDLSEATKRKAQHGRDIMHIVRNAAKTALTAAIIKKVSDIVRRVT